MNALLLPEILMGAQPADQAALALASEGVQTLRLAKRVWTHADRGARRCGVRQRRACAADGWASRGKLGMTGKAAKRITVAASPPADEGFDAIVDLIDAARQRAYRAVNTTLIELYWQIGEHISRKIAAAEWGAGVVDRLAAYIARTQPGLRGFTRPNLFRMRQFHEAYAGADDQLASTLRQIPWTHHMIILGQSKSAEERDFYLRLMAQERWSKRELERQFKLALFERVVLSPPKVSPVVRQSRPEAAEAFKDAYMLEFLGLPATHSEADLHGSLLTKLRQFLIELGRDFCFAGSEFPVQVGGRDFALDLLFFHRGLNCLVAIELKVGRFEPEYLGWGLLALSEGSRDSPNSRQQGANRSDTRRYREDLQRGWRLFGEITRRAGQPRATARCCALVVCAGHTASRAPSAVARGCPARALR
jgi:predicted nuclease of restriction endonuclease-like (RecB) superfamily